MEKKINLKGFNLFSIIVAATLLMIGTILVSTLVSTEETTSTEIYMMTSDFELSDAASLARADALQTFNYQFRKRIQDYLNYSTKIDDAGFRILDTDGDYGSFENIVESFERVILLADPDEGDVENLYAVINSISERTIDSFPDGRYGKYLVSISDTSTAAIDDTTDIILGAIEKDFDEGNRFLDVVGCNESDCDIGSFYFNIPLNKIDPITYEKLPLPKIVVRDLTTNEEMRIPLLPRSNLKIYIPLRFFKAVHHAKDNLEAVRNAENDMEDARLGYCEPNNCVPREHPLIPATGMTDWDSDCGSTQTLSAGIPGHPTYNTGVSPPGSSALISFAKAQICSSYSTTATLNPPFKNYNDRLIEDEITSVPIPNCGFYKIIGLVRGPQEKTVDTAGGLLRCSELTGIRADVIFKETHPQYIVDGERILYKIRINSRDLRTLPPRNIGTCSTGGGECRFVN